MDSQELNTLIAAGDKNMFAHNPCGALKSYKQAWSLYREHQDSVKSVWLLLSIANAAVQAGNYEEAFEALAGLQEGFAETRLIAGNPLFHLLVGLTYNGLGENKEGESDNFARALICGGPAIFKGEDPVHIERMKSILRPPNELGTWDGYEGCSRDLLNGASGYLFHLVTQKIGDPPPYRYQD